MVEGIEKLYVDSDLEARVVFTRISDPCDNVINATIDNFGAKNALAYFGNIIKQKDDIDENVLLAYRNAKKAEESGVDIDAKNPSMHVGKKAVNIENRLGMVDLKRDLLATQSLKSAIVTPESDAWVKKFDDLGLDKPYCLWVRGSLDALMHADDKAISIVGTRNMTEKGARIASELGSELSAQGYAIVSGGAIGIDASAHRGALGGQNIAFFAGGIDSLYPSINADLYDDMLRTGGTFVSESPPLASPRRFRFLQRNRQIAAIGRAVVVVEAPYRSGALSTASHADALNRPVGAFPGPVTAPTFAGCNKLIRDGRAVLLTSSEDVIELASTFSELRARKPKKKAQQQLPTAWKGNKKGVKAVTLDKARELGDDEAHVFDTIPLKSGITVPQIVERTGMGTVRVQRVLGRLELNGFVRENESKWYLK
ncbi:MAG: DNA-protecting protein DprA [Bifidobacteriaceae bacterium]|jgi:DNA processing protein|nr:DNA-protecting protein DprA [Bifidobacteriaceae bacterium]